MKTQEDLFGSSIPKPVRFSPEGQVCSVWLECIRGGKGPIAFFCRQDDGSGCWSTWVNCSPAQ